MPNEDAKGSFLTVPHRSEMLADAGHPEIKATPNGCTIVYIEEGNPDATELVARTTGKGTLLAYYTKYEDQLEVLRKIAFKADNNLLNID